MRHLVTVLFAATALTACLGAPSEPLGGTEQQSGREQQSPQEQLRQQMIAEIALAMGEAADVSLGAADAGLARNLAAAELSAAQAASVAELVRQRAAEVVTALSEAGEGDCGGSEAAAQAGTEISDDDLNDAVAAALCAADAAHQVSAALVPQEASTECVCGVCEEVGGGIDEVALADAIDSVTAASVVCGDSEDVLTDGNHTSF